MKRTVSFVLIIIMLVSALVSCGGNGDESSAIPVSEPEQSAETSFSETVSEESEGESSEAMLPDENAGLIWEERFADPDAGLGSAADIYKADYYFDGALINDYSKNHKDGDTRFVFRGLENSRVVNFADGYMLTVPSAEVSESE